LPCRRHHLLLPEGLAIQLLPLDTLGAHEIAPHRVQFGLFLPWVSAQNGHQLVVKILHKQDQFLQDVPPLVFPLQHTTDATYGGYWSGQIALHLHPADRLTPTSAWWMPGTYVYRYELRSPLLHSPLDWIVDPFACEFGVGRQAAITLGYTDHPWGPAIELQWKTPHLRDLIVYELMPQEFAADLEAAAKLPYLRDLGVNCLEIMPVANVERSVDWGFEPIGLFGVDERFGNRRTFQHFVEAAHCHGMAVVLDMIYGHTGRHFAYEYVYAHLRYHQNPFMGAFGDEDLFGASTDFRRTYVQDFYYTVNHFWLDRYHVDGIRYDCVPNYWDGVTGRGYANLVYHCRFGTINLYREVLREGQRDHWFKGQPYLIGLLLSQGIPLLWQGQEIVENYDVPAEGPARIGTLRPVCWELFYDEAGRGMIRLVRKLLALRNAAPVFRRGAFYVHNDWERWQSRGLLLFSRWIDTTYALVALNFTDAEHTTTFWFPIAGDYTEQLAGQAHLHAVPAGHAVPLTIPSHYGGIWLHA
jgi:1,4-alpha-glucan branching enzyme